MKIVIFGLSITSSWGNGHATTFRSLCNALHRRGHTIVFFERDQEWYRANRDLPEPPYCRIEIFQDWKRVLPHVRAYLREADMAVVGSYFHDGIAALGEVIESNVGVKAFYDIDTPITIRRLQASGVGDYLLARQIPELDIYFSFTGGPLLDELRTEFGAVSAVPLYCSVDPEKHRGIAVPADFKWDLSYMGTYAPDRQAKLEDFLCRPARQLPDGRFIVAGPQYPPSISWPANVERMMHLSPRYHADFYCSSRLTLNVTRREMVIAGYSPSVRLFEAAACGAAIVSDNWPGLETFFIPGQEILLPANGDDVLRYISGYDTAELQQIGNMARERVLSAHTSNVRAREFESAAEAALHRRRSPVAIVTP